jgi:hypothetical protein
MIWLMNAQWMSLRMNTLILLISAFTIPYTLIVPDIVYNIILRQQGFFNARLLLLFCGRRAKASEHKFIENLTAVKRNSPRTVLAFMERVSPLLTE